MRSKLSLTALVLFAFALNGCFKDVVLEKYTFYRPVYKTKTQVRAEIKGSIPQTIKHPGKLFVRGNYIFLNDIERGVHVIDYSTPASPKKVAFIPIPGNVDLAVKGNYLYADQFRDLVTIDISNPLNATLVNVDENVFPQKHWIPDSNLVIVDWLRIDTTVKHKDYVSFEKSIIAFGGVLTNFSPNAASNNGGGKGGSMARFTLMSDRLYTVSSSTLKVFNTANAADPNYLKQVFLGAGDIETIYPFKNNLFIGSMTGMHIYSVANIDNPVKTGMFSHAMACDPVIADDNYAYVTLRSGTTCTRQISDQMDVINVTNVNAPSLVKSYPFTNPHGLDKDGNYIFLCDGKGGLKVLDATSPNNITTIKTFGEIETYDVIAVNNLAITVAKDGLYLVDYSNIGNIKILSKITTN
jgi:hypothetical protein